MLEECILDHYGREAALLSLLCSFSQAKSAAPTAYVATQVGYVFAWANLFTRSLWVLTSLCLIFYICGARAQLGGYEGVLSGAYPRGWRPLLSDARIDIGMRMHDMYRRYLSTPTVQVVRDAILHSLLGHLSQCAGWIEKICVEKRWRRRLHELSGSLADNSSAASCSSQPLESVQTWHLLILP